jgi:diguanylate cyclase (GGDEF)-like protein
VVGPRGLDLDLPQGGAIDPILVILAIVATVVTLGLLVHLATEEVRAARRRRRARGEGEPPPLDRREAIELVGNALAATHDTRGLLPVVLDVAVEATGAAGGAVLIGDRELASVGKAGEQQPIELELGASTGEAEIRLELYPPPRGFTDDTTDLAEWLASQASIALDNARLHDVIRRQALTDELTGLVNRRGFTEALESEITRARRLDATLSILFADLDDFKKINDRFGHSAGDEALRTFADLLRGHLRTIDPAARLGGEEVAILLPATDVEGALVVGERIRKHLAESEVLKDDLGGAGLTASIGVVEFHSGSPDELLRRADAALYRAKEQGKNRVVADRA